MSSNLSTVVSTNVPAQNPDRTNPSVVDQAKSITSEHDSQRKMDNNIANKKSLRFAPRRPTALTSSYKSAPEYETLIFKSASNSPLTRLNDMTVSTFVPNFQIAFVLINQMDTLMASTKRWTDNCQGWVPPISQMYFALLLFIQVLRASDAAGTLSPATGLPQVLADFERIYPLSELMIPGPLVLLFKSIASFWPSATDRFGNVTPALPATPGWTRARRLVPAPPSAVCLPNISLFITRLRNVCTVALNAQSDAEFQNTIDGPRIVSDYFHFSMDDNNHEQWLFSSPGSNLEYAGNLKLWKDAATSLTRLAIPADIDANVEITDNWTSFMRLSLFPDEFVWFPPIAATMAKYSQFFKGSTSLADCDATSSATGAIKLSTSENAGNTLMSTPEFVAAIAGNPAAVPPVQAFPGRRVLFPSIRAVFDATVPIPDIPESSKLAALTYAINLPFDDSADQQVRTGPFWNLVPNVAEATRVEVLPGTLTTMMREYHSDSRIDSEKQ